MTPDAHRTTCSTGSALPASGDPV